MVIGHLCRKPHWLKSLKGERDLTLYSPAWCCFPWGLGGQVAFVGLGLPYRESGPKPSTPSPDFRCQPVKSTDGKETQPDLEVASWVSNYDFKMACFPSFSFVLFHFSFVLKIEHLTSTSLFRVRRKLTVAHQCLSPLPGIRDLSISVLELLLYVRIHTEDFM